MDGIQLYNTGHVTSFTIVLRPFVSFGAINVILTSWFLPRYAQCYRLSNESVLYGIFCVDLRFVLLQQTILLDAEFKYLLIFSIWVKSTLLNWNKNNKSRYQHDKYGRKIVFHMLTMNIRQFHPRVEWPYIQWQPMNTGAIVQDKMVWNQDC